MQGLELDHISFSAGGRQILRDISLGVRNGETVALLGPSGSGKTTLLRVVAGLERAASGSVRFDGAEMTGIPAHERGFGMMFQDHALFPHLNVAKNVEFGLRRAGGGTRAIAARRAEVLELVGLSGFEHRTLEKLSGGERQRVALARSLAPQPRLLMLDEPLGSLDRGLRERLAADLRGILTRLQVTALYVTHDQFEAFTVADRIAILDAGRIVRIDTPRGIWDDPQTEFVARFLGMENIVRGTRGADGAWQTALGSFVPEGASTGGGTLLLRTEGAALVSASGPNVAAGTVTAARFRGGATEVTIRSGDEKLTFEVPSAAAAPEPGSTIYVAIPRVQVLRPTTMDVM